MRRERQHYTLTRQQLGQWAGFVGGGVLLIGVLGLIWQGGLTGFITAALIVGAIGIGLWALLAPRDFVGFVTGRQIRQGAVAVFSTLLLIGIVALVYVLTQRAVITLDMTLSTNFSLSSQSDDVLRRVSRPIQITGFYTPASLRLREVDDQFFRQYTVATDGLISRVYYDPEENPTIAQSFGAIEDGMVFVSYLNADGSVDYDTVARVPRGQRQERDMTGAISRLLFAGTLTVYFEISHGEFDPLDDSQQGLSGINAGVQESGLITAPLDLTALAASGGTIPEDASVVVFARPVTDLSEAELRVIDEYLGRGGALFLMADVLFNENAFLAEGGLFNRYLWEFYGIRALNAVVVDEASSAQTPLDIVSAAVFAESDIAERLDPETTPTLFRTARPIEVNFENPPVNGGRVIATSPQSYAETNLEALRQTNTFSFDADADIPGPLTTTAWAWDLETDARIVLVGDGEFVTNGQIVSPPGNAVLFTDAIGWLTSASDELSFGFQTASDNLPLIFVSTQTLDLIAFATVILMPGLVLLIGLGVWLRRSRR